MVVTVWKIREEVVTITVCSSCGYYGFRNTITVSVSKKLNFYTSNTGFRSILHSIIIIINEYSRA
nr:hypothetical protein [Neolewinella agarilytica]